LSEKFQSRNQSQLPAVLVGPWAQPLFSALAIVLVGIDMDTIGRTRWAVAEGYIPSQSSFSDRALISHETACILNAGDQEAHVNITIFFTDREPIGPYRVAVTARRTLLLRFNDLEQPAPVPRDTIILPFSKPTFRSSFSTTGLILVTPKSACFQPRLTPRSKPRTTF